MWVEEKIWLFMNLGMSYISSLFFFFLISFFLPFFLLRQELTKLPILTLTFSSPSRFRTHASPHGTEVTNLSHQALLWLQLHVGT